MVDKMKGSENSLEKQLEALKARTEAYVEVPTEMDIVHVCILPKRTKSPKSAAVLLRLPGARRGIYLRESESLSILREVINDQRLENLIQIIEKITANTRKNHI